MGLKNYNDAFLGQLYKSKGKMDSQCVQGLRTLIDIMAEDENVCKYVWSQPSPSLQYARYTDWFFPYAIGLKQTTLKNI